MKELLMFLLLLSAVYYDVKEKRIPNFLFLIGAMGCLLIVFCQKGAQEMGRSILMFLLIAAICWPLFYLRAVGAGDIKLLGILGAMLDLTFFLQTMLVFLTFSGIGAFAILCKRGLLTERMTYAWQYITDRDKEKGQYYNKSRDGTDMTIILTPFLLTAYLAVLVGRWCII